MKDKKQIEEQHTLFFKGLEWKQNGNYKEAEYYYNQAIELGESDLLAKIYYNKGVLLDQHLDNKKEALTYYQKAISINPDYQIAWNNMGTILLDFHQYKKALDAFEKAVALEPREIFSLVNKAYAQNRLALFKESLPILQSLLNREEEVQEKLQDKLFLLYSELGLALLYNQKIKESIPYFEKAIELNKKDYQAYYNLGFIFDMLREYEKAITFYDKAIEIDPNDRSSYQGKGCTYIHTKEFNKALPLIQKSIELDSSNFEGYYNLACIYAGLQEKENMIAALKRTIELAPTQLNIKNHLKNDKDFSTYATDPLFIELMN